MTATVTEAAVRTRVAAVVSGVTNVGVVHTFQRQQVPWAAFLDLFRTTISSTATARGWMLYLAGPVEADVYNPDLGYSKVKVERVYTYWLDGYYALVDSAPSEAGAVTWVESVMNALDLSVDLHGGGSDWADIPPAQLLAFEPRRIGGINWHFARIEQQMRERVAIS